MNQGIRPQVARSRCEIPVNHIDPTVFPLGGLYYPLGWAFVFGVQTDLV